MRVLLVLLLWAGAVSLQAADAVMPYPQEPPAGTEIVHPVDGAIMVWVPGGTFIMGMDQEEADAAVKAVGLKDWEEAWAWEWFPRRTVYVPGYFIDKYEVTRGLWERYAAERPVKPMKGIAKGPKEDTPGDFAAYPATTVFWAEAQQYANWAGKQLPSEEQWEKAARGTDGRLYPWGAELPTPELGVFVDMQTKQISMIQPVGSHPQGASPYGCMDMAGNVYEWTRDWQEPYPNNPEYARMLQYMGHGAGSLRGGSFYHGPVYVCAKRFGFEVEIAYYHVGFRPVWVPPADYFASPAFAADKDKVPAAKAEIERLRKIGKPGGCAI